MSEKQRFEIDRECASCHGTGLYVGMAERDGAAVICHVCKGTGCEHAVLEYVPFTARAVRGGIRRVFQVNPGIVIGTGKRGEYTLDDFGGMPASEWDKGKPFPPGSENRRFTCPAWWYQSADYDKKPKWKECELVGSFSCCSHFANKVACWDRWDRENKP